MTIKNQSFFCSWSGGKDSCLALYRAIKEGGSPKLLLTMFTEKGDRSRSHGLPTELFLRQSESIGIPFIHKNATWGDYESVFIETLKGLRNDGIRAGVFGDIDLEDHRLWEEKVCQEAELIPYLPLWKEERLDLLREFINLGFKAVIVAVKDNVMDQSFLGKVLDIPLMDQLGALGIDACGEEGEFHTVVVDGPIFNFPIELELKDQVFNSGYWFQDIEIIK